MLQQYVNQEIPDVQAGFKKGRGIGDQIANILWIMEKARDFQKNIYFCFIDYTKPFDCVDHKKKKKKKKKTMENSSRNGNTRPLYLSPEKPCMWVKKQLLESDMEQWTGSKLGKDYVHQGCILSPCFFNLCEEYIM